MATKPRVSKEQILMGHPGLPMKSRENQCVTDYFSDGSYRYNDSSEILDGTIESDGTHNCPEGELFVYRECGKTACRRQVGMVIDADNRIIDAQPFVAPCTGKL
jgi:hypothetical protein